METCKGEEPQGKESERGWRREEARNWGLKATSLEEGGS